MAHAGDENGVARLGDGECLGNSLTPVGNLLGVACPTRLVDAAQDCLANASWLFVVALFVGNDNLISQASSNLTHDGSLRLVAIARRTKDQDDTLLGDGSR